MKLAIMQPYFFPYLGYFQLIASVDKFVFLDDVNFIKKGWINKNRILVQSEAHNFTVPLSKVSQNVKINETKISTEFANWRDKFLQTLMSNYRKAPEFEKFYPELRAFLLSRNDTIISDLAKASLNFSMRWLQLEAPFIDSASQFENGDLKGQNRILDICKKLETTTYKNLPGGRQIYQKESFQQNDISLEFLEPQLPEYNQGKDCEFISGLSILDILFHCELPEAQEMVKSGIFTN